MEKAQTPYFVLHTLAYVYGTCFPLHLYLLASPHVLHAQSHSSLMSSHMHLLMLPFTLDLPHILHIAGVSSSFKSHHKVTFSEEFLEHILFIAVHQVSFLIKKKLFLLSNRTWTHTNCIKQMYCAMNHYMANIFATTTHIKKLNFDSFSDTPLFLSLPAKVTDFYHCFCKFFYSFITKKYISLHYMDIYLFTYLFGISFNSPYF